MNSVERSFFRGHAAHYVFSTTGKTFRTRLLTVVVIIYKEVAGSDQWPVRVYQEDKVLTSS